MILLAIVIPRNIVLITGWGLCAIAACRCLLIAVSLWRCGVSLLPLRIAIVATGSRSCLLIAAIAWTRLLTTRSTTKAST
jgi:hypothetical protein